jgi:hypothetical protein
MKSFVQDPELEVEPLSSLKDSTRDSPASSAVPRGPNVTVNQRPASTGTSTGTCEVSKLQKTDGFNCVSFRRFLSS